MPRISSHLQLLGAFAAGEASSVYATFFAHAVRPPSVYVIDRYTHHRVSAGKIGDLEEVFHWDGLILVLVLSLIVFGVAWCVIRVAVEYADHLRSQTVVRSEATHAAPFAQALVGSRTETASTGSAHV
jgi:hypothetical protein